MRKIRTQLVLALISIQLVSLFISGLVTIVISAARLTTEVTGMEADIMGLALALDEVDNEKLSELISQYTDYSVVLADESAEFAPAELAMLEKDGSVAKGRHGAVRTYFMMDGEMYMVCYTSSNISILVNYVMREMLFNITTIGISIIALFLLSEYLTRPMVELTLATQRIAAGDFSVRVHTTGNADRPYNQLDQLMINFNKMTEDLQSIEYLRRDFTSNVSHEIKTPISAISGYARLIMDENTSLSDRAEYAKTISQECARLTKLSDNLLRITRLESSKLEPTFERYALDEQLRRILTTMMPEIEAKGLKLSVELATKFVSSDKELMEQVFINLIGNAIKFTPDGGSIAVSLVSGEDCARVVVSDTGIGISEEAQAHIFEKFYQADASHHTDGNGLGLSLVKRIVDVCGCTLSVKSQLNKGSKFIVDIPYKPREITMT